MTLTPAQQQQIRKNMSTLDYLHGEGIIKSPKRLVTNSKDCYLIVGLGGTGGNALAEVKKQMTDSIDPVSLDQYVRFLAIDSCEEDIQALIQKGYFSTNETCKLPYIGARGLLSAPNPFMRQWLNPNLKNHQQGALDGTGAGNRRQFGRVLLCSGQAIKSLKAQVGQCFNELRGAPGNNGAVVNLIVLAGIAGGTGSGSVIDATYIITEILSRTNRDWFGRSYGFIFLPPASSDVARPAEQHTTGNGNGYAALKEIEYFMTLESRAENGSPAAHFIMNYDGFSVNQGNLFDHCFLIDGHSEAVYNLEPRTAAARTAADCIVNMIAAEQSQEQVQAANGGAGAQTASLLSAISNVPANIEAFVVSQEPSAIPRDSHYIFSATGYSSCLIPADLLTIYAAKKVFDAMYEMYKRSGDADAEAARALLSELGFTSSELTDQLDREFKKVNPGLFARASEVSAAVDEAREAVTAVLESKFNAQIDGIFRSKGPYYLINLMLHLGQFLSGRGAVAVSGSGKKSFEDDAIRKIYTHFSRMALETNRTTWDVYCAVIDELKRILDSTETVFTDTFVTRQGKVDTYTWTPIKTMDSAGLRWIDSYMNPERIANLISAFQQDLINKKDEWLKHAGDRQFNAAGLVRQFIEDNFHDILHLNIQDFVARCYSNDPDAVALEPDGSPSPALLMAAEVIADKLCEVDVLAQIRNLSKYNDAPMQQVLILPEETPQLNTEIKRLIQGRDNMGANLSYYKSEKGQSITLFTNRFGLPLGEFTWVAEGEQAYAEVRDIIGLHLYEANTNWRGLPNLTNSALWNTIRVGYTFHEEEILAKHVCDLIESAQQYGLVSELNAVFPQQYSISLLDDSDNSDLGKAIVPFLVMGETIQQDESAVKVYEEQAESLFALIDKGQIHDINLLRDALPPKTFNWQATKPHEMPMNDGGKPSPNFEWKYTARFLRKMYRTCISLERTLGVIALLRDMVEANNRQLLAASEKDNRALKFSTYYSLSLIDQNEEGIWVYQTEVGTEEELLVPIDLLPFQMPFHHYYMNEKYLQLPDEVFAFFETQTEELIKDPALRASRQERKVKLLAELQEVKVKNYVKTVTWANSFNQTARSGEIDVAKKLQEYYKEEIEQLGGVF